MILARKLSRIVVVLLLGMAVGLSSLPLRADQLPEARDFTLDAKIAKKKNLPILVFFYADFCEYCHEVRTLYLHPLSVSKAYRNKLLFRAVNTGAVTSLRDFQGKKTSHEGFASAEAVGFTPVIRIYDADGKELGELYGYTTPDFYSWELTKVINRSIAKLRAAKKAARR